MTIPGILVVTGASGSGKTAAVRALEARALSGVRCYYFDAVGVPPVEQHGSGGPEGWQAVTTKEWLGRLDGLLGSLPAWASGCVEFAGHRYDEP
jgi:hypothetical protein